MFVAWQSRESEASEPTVEAVLIRGDEVGARGELTGWLSGAVSSRRNLLVVTTNSDEGRAVVSRQQILPIPVPISRKSAHAGGPVAGAAEPTVTSDSARLPQPIPIPTQSISVALRLAPPTQPIPIERFDPPPTCTALTDDGAVVGVVVEPGVVAIVREVDGELVGPEYVDSATCESAITPS